MNHLVYLIMDSCRYDSFAAARTPSIDKLGKAEKRYSFASWTSPSHQVLLMGITPHTNPTHVFASEVYKQDFLLWRRRLGVENLEFRTFLPQLSLPYKLKNLGYKTVGRVSLPVLNEMTTFSAHFDSYKLMDNHNDFAGMIDEMEFSDTRPVFYFCNLGETHYPYMLPKGDLPVLHGVHGVFKHMDEQKAAPGASFNDIDFSRLHRQQITTVEYIDTQVEKLFKKCPRNTYFIITADHGELFGEDGYFGHGPVFHEKVFEVPFIEGPLPTN